jgi:hypothetical protein
VTDIVVDRLRLACRAGRQRRADALAVRRRLESIARRELPRALAARAHAWPDAELDRVPVRLDFDPADYDDVTLAVLWADRIAVAVERALSGETTIRGSRARGEGRRIGADGAPAPRGGAAPETGHGGSPLTIALIDLAIAGDAAALLRLAAALEDPAARREVLAAIAPGRHRRLAERLEALAASPATWLGEPGAGSRPVVVPAASETRTAAGAAPEPVAPGALGAEGLERLRIAARLVRQAAGSHQAAAVAVAGAPTIVPTGFAGLVLLYPWLGRLLDDAVAVRPDHDPVAARRLALAAIVAAEHTDDPLVRLLAGDRLDEPPVPLTADPAAEAAADARDAILRRLAGALRGFERSSPAFVRRELVVRPGTIDPAVEPVPVVLAPMPLDVLLPALPYPLGLFRLAWTPAITIRAGR